MIEIINLTKSFDKKTVLKNFNAIFRQGMTCLMGESGIGKTTLANLILGLLEPDSGEIRGVQGKIINCVFQENRLIEQFSAMKNLLLVCSKAKKNEALALLCQMGMQDNTQCPVSTLSGGMKRRVEIARALINPADIYIFDEPFKELDSALKGSVIKIIKEYTQGATSIVITHDSADIEALGAQVVNIV